MLLLAAPLARADATASPDLRAEVVATERAFAQTMADRDHAAFARFVADDAIFINGAGALRGKAAIAAAWQKLYATPQAPFSWAPSLVEVNDAGTLAISRGPVYDPSGKLVSGFSSIWRRDAPGVWKIIFDQGTDVRACDLEAKP
ncbi:nuclear transport factor 2 family protein [Solimonas terrae]|uniref:Nuclear transport factor 2 family protein n=2 Tax=Solimonas terrae TaxID=1396819 RepID=A0A6M2BQS4_9GAMM|nr:nuclear transport factor 2 family protein [Solimonas terrae]